jgi:replicative DNA helicase Mcm
MTPEKTARLITKYPKMFPEDFWFEYSDGWYDLTDNLCSQIQSYVDENDNVKQITASQFKEKFGCYDTETEVLTKDGWKYFVDVGMNDLLATINPSTHIMEYQAPSDLISYDYSGPMYQLQARGVDLFVTPNHNMFWAKGNSMGAYKAGNTKIHDMEFSTPEKYFQKTKRFLKSATWVGKKENAYTLNGWKYSANTARYNRTYTISDKTIDMDNWLALLGIIVAEGCIDKRGDTVGICADNSGSEKARLEQLAWEKIITDCGYKYAKSGLDKPAVVYNIYSQQLSKWCAKNIKHRAENKRAPDFIKELPPHQIEIFLKWLYRGDGHKSKTANTLYTVSKGLSDDVQELILKAGYASSHVCRDQQVRNLERKKTVGDRNIVGNYDCHCINWLTNSNSFNISGKTFRDSNSYVEQWTTYSGKVYCATVPNHTLFVRRNGKGVWCGNSLRAYIDPEDGESDIDDMIYQFTRTAEKVSETTCESCGKAGKIITKNHWLRCSCSTCAEEK